MNDDLNLARIQRLSTILANQIAAGEVIERPASVVKELLENAIDANATRISIDVQRAGISLIRVTDNGNGIYPDDLQLALESHATSKIRQTSDLDNISSLGFRGEALASIASVAHFSLGSCHDSGKQGLSLKQSPGQTAEIEPLAHNRGTTVEVRDLFFNTPARRKFLRSENTEYLHILALVKATALSQFDCVFQLKHNERSVLSVASSTNDYSRRVADICGQAFLQGSMAFDFSHENMRFWGWLAKPELARSQTDRQYLYLNGRLIKDKNINHAVRLAFKDRLYHGRFPCYVLFLEIDPSLVDVNVHPSKQEVRFRRSRDVHDFIYSSLQEVLSPESSLAMEIPVFQTAGNMNEAKALDVQERQTDYRINHKQEVDYKFAKRTGNHELSVSNKRYLLFELEEDFFVLDSHTVRMEMLATIMKQQLDKGRVISRPLLMPVDIQAKEKDLDRIEDHETLLANFGLAFKRVAPDRLLIKELPELCRYINIEFLFSDVIEFCKGKKPELKEQHELIDIIASHANDDLPEQLNKDEQKMLIEYCLQQQDDNQGRHNKNKWRLLDEQDLKKLLS